MPEYDEAANFMHSIWNYYQNNNSLNTQMCVFVYISGGMQTPSSRYNISKNRDKKKSVYVWEKKKKIMMNTDFDGSSIRWTIRMEFELIVMCTKSY